MSSQLSEISYSDTERNPLTRQPSRKIAANFYVCLLWTRILFIELRNPGFNALLLHLIGVSDVWWQQSRILIRSHETKLYRIDDVRFTASYIRIGMSCTLVCPWLHCCMVATAAGALHKPLSSVICQWVLITRLGQIALLSVTLKNEIVKEYRQ